MLWYWPIQEERIGTASRNKKWSLHKFRRRAGNLVVFGSRHGNHSAVEKIAFSKLCRTEHAACFEQKFPMFLVTGCSIPYQWHNQQHQLARLIICPLKMYFSTWSQQVKAAQVHLHTCSSSALFLVSTADRPSYLSVTWEWQEMS